MNIGFGTVSPYDSVRYELFFDGHHAYFNTKNGEEFSMVLGDYYLREITLGRKLFLTMTQMSPGYRAEHNITNYRDSSIHVLQEH